MINNLIERRAAIDALCDNCDNTQAVCAHYPCKQYIAVEKLPSVQTDIVRCKDCYYCATENCWGRPFYYCDAFSYHAEGDLIGVSLQVSPEHFCGWAERRTDE